MAVRVLTTLLLAAGLACAAAQSSPILVFNDEAQAAVRTFGIQSQIASRIYSLVHIAQYIAINPKDSAAVQTASAAQAGHIVLKQLFPWRFSSLDKAIKPFLDGLSNKDKRAAEKRGAAAAEELLERSIEDGFNRFVPFTPAPAGGPTGKYQFVPNQTYAVYPQIATTKPLVLDSITSFKPAPPLTIPSSEYTDNLKSVFELGSRTSTARTAFQTETAYFWLDNNLTSTHAGHFNQVARALLKPTTPLRTTARIFALLNVATWDASLATYKAKFDNVFWRPITAIRQGDGSAANADYVDATWTPLVNTPSHPEYPSGHSATAASAALIIDKVFTEKAFTVGTEYPNLAPRAYSNVWEAVEEVNWSRIYAGVHFEHAVVQGADLGKRVAEQVYKRFDAKYKPLK